MTSKLNKNTRLNKYISNSGFCSRRKADEFIKNERVKVNNKITTDFSITVSDEDEITIDGIKISSINKKYFLINKPKDYICTISDEKDRKKVLDILNENDKKGIHIVGRLDRNTTGVILVTNDGELTHKLIHPSFNISKIYKATIDKPIVTQDINKLKSGIILEKKIEKFDNIIIVPNTNKTQIIIEIHSGKNHFIKNMLKSLNYRVKNLDRLSFATLTCDKLKRGEYRPLTINEIKFLKSLN